MPLWLSIVGLVAFFVVSVSTIIKGFRALARGTALLDEGMPLLREVVLVFRDNPSAFRVLDEIAAEFRTDSGSSLRDIVNELASTNRRVQAEAIVLAANVEAVRLLAVQDRSQAAASRQAVLDLGQGVAPGELHEHLDADIIKRGGPK